ncbi:hypothetical protein D478_26714, partial [Brevibacillus agri BAB-2500]
WTVATFCLVAAVFGCVAENVIQNTLTNYERIFYATLVFLNIKRKMMMSLVQAKRTSLMEKVKKRRKTKRKQIEKLSR